MHLPLTATIWDDLDRKVRNQIRKAEKSGLVVERGGEQLLADFYAVFARNMRDLGTPVYSRRLFEEVLRTFPDRAQLHIVRLNGRPVAAGLTYRTAFDGATPVGVVDSRVQLAVRECPAVLGRDPVRAVDRRGRVSTWAAPRPMRARSSSRLSGAPNQYRSTGNISCPPTGDFPTSVPRIRNSSWQLPCGRGFRSGSRLELVR